MIEEKNVNHNNQNNNKSDMISEKIILINQEVVDLIAKEKYESALDLLKKAEKELEVI